MYHPIISIIIPVYNSEKYLDRCLESVLCQTMENIEVIVVNDGSTDNSIQIINKYLKKYNNLILINQKNLGQGIARNAALQICKGEYIGFVDSDDFIRNDMFESMYKKAKKYDLDVVICNFLYYYPENNIYKSTGIEYDDSMILNKYNVIKEFFVTNNIEGFSWNKLFNRKLFDCNNIKYPDNMNYEDIPTIFNLLVVSDKIGFINKKLYYYCQHRESTVHTKNVYNTESYLKAISIINKIIVKYNLVNNFFEEYYYYFVKQILSNYESFIKYLDKDSNLYKLFNKFLELISLKLIFKNKYFIKNYKVKIKAVLLKVNILDKFIKLNNIRKNFYLKFW